MQKLQHNEHTYSTILEIQSTEKKKKAHLIPEMHYICMRFWSQNKKVITSVGLVPSFFISFGYLYEDNSHFWIPIGYVYLMVFLFLIPFWSIYHARCNHLHTQVNSPEYQYGLQRYPPNTITPVNNHSHLDIPAKCQHSTGITMLIPMGRFFNPINDVDYWNHAYIHL
jgi:hypothetical protein